MQLLNYEDYIPIAFGSCQLLKELSINPNLDPVQYISQIIPWCQLNKFDLGLFAEYGGVPCPRLLLGETVVNGRKTLVVAFRETKGIQDWADNTKMFGSFDTFTAVTDFYSGNMHSAFRARAKLLPLGPIFERLEAHWDVVFTGFSQGSAVAEAATIMLMNNICWKPHWLQQVIFIGFASPLLHDATLASELLVDHYKNDPTEQRSLILHHFVYRQDIVSRALTLCSNANRLFSEQITSWLAGTITGTISLELAKLIIPDYQPCGNWHLLSGNAVQHLQAHKSSDFKILQDEIFFPWKIDGKLTLEAKHFHHHGNNHYYRELHQYYPSKFAYIRIPPPIRSLLAPINTSNTTTEAWWDKGQLKVLVQGPNVMWTDTVTINYKGRLETFSKDTIGTCSYHQIVVVSKVPVIPDASVQVEILSSLSAHTTKFQAIPQVYTNITANEYLQKCALPELLQIASLVSLLTHPTVQNPAINTMTSLLTKIVGNVPLEVAYLPLAIGNKLSTHVREFLKANDPPAFQLLSKVGISILRAAFQALERLQGTEQYTDLAYDLSTVMDFVSKGIRKYAVIQARTAPTPDLRNLFFDVVSATVMGPPAVSLSLIALSHYQKNNLEHLITKFGSSTNQFCGLSMGDISGATYVSSILHQKQINIANLETTANEHRGDLNCRKDVLRITTMEIEQFGVLVDQVVAFFSEKKMKELGGNDYSISLTGTPKKFTSKQVVDSFLRGTAPNTEPLRNFAQWALVNTKTFPTYEYFVVWLAEKIAEMQKDKVAPDVWNAEAYILGVADEPDALDSQQTATHITHMWTTISRFVDFPDQFKFGMSCKMQQIAYIHQLRTVLSSLPLVGLFGTSNSGKTFLMKKILGGLDSLPEPGSDLSCRTVFPRIYSHPQQAGVCVLDTMGLDDPELERKSNLLFNIPKVVVILTDATDHTHSVTSKLLKFTSNVVAGRPPKNTSWVACLTILNKVDKFYEDDTKIDLQVLDNEEQQRPASHMFPVVIRNNSSFPRWWASLFPKEFKNRDIPAKLRYQATKSPKGIHSLQDVLDWINQATHDSGMMRSKL